MKRLSSGAACTIAVATVVLALVLATAALGGSPAIEADVVYGHKMGLALTFDVLRPEQPNGAGVLFMVSGGWFSRWSPPERAVERFAPLLDAGFTVFQVRHGSAPMFKVPEAVDDVRQAVRYIRQHAALFGVDADRLGAWGGSAGGHLSLMLGTTGEDGDAQATDPLAAAGSRIAAVVAYFPPVDLRGLTGPNERFPALDFDPELAPAVSPILHVSADDPPSLMVHGDKDTLVPLTHSQRIQQAFNEHGVANELVVLEGAEHGFRGEHAEQAVKAVVAWFETHLAKPSRVQTTSE